VNRIRPTVRAWSLRIIEREIAGRDTAADIGAALENAFGRLHRLMSSLVGNVGFAAVMSRAVHVTQPRCPCIEAAELEIGETLRMRGLAAAIERDGADPVVACAAELLGTTLDLLCAFIGEELTLRIIRTGWTGLEEES
jgi:hypothetical protein